MRAGDDDGAAVNQGHTAERASQRRPRHPGRQAAVRARICLRNVLSGPGADVGQVPVQMWASSRCRCGPGLDGFAQALVSVDLHSRRFGRRRRHPAHVKATTACCDEPSRATPRRSLGLGRAPLYCSGPRSVRGSDCCGDLPRSFFAGGRELGNELELRQSTVKPNTVVQVRRGFRVATRRPVSHGGAKRCHSVHDGAGGQPPPA